ncbi:MAG TPA: aspartate/glutamate racemase family protein [Gillisia sp.]|nr:aspartate/glutamate racemase family protein [Gillisia sp.]
MANTPHLVFDFVQSKIDIPILHITDAVGEEARNLGLSQLGLLGTSPSKIENYISSRLKEKYNINSIIPMKNISNKITIKLPMNSPKVSSVMTQKSFIWNK